MTAWLQKSEKAELQQRCVRQRIPFKSRQGAEDESWTDEYMRATELRPSLSMPCQSRFPVLMKARRSASRRRIDGHGPTHLVKSPLRADVPAYEREMASPLLAQTKAEKAPSAHDI